MPGTCMPMRPTSPITRLLCLRGLRLRDASLRAPFPGHNCRGARRCPLHSAMRLPARLCPKPRILFVGINPSLTSARVRSEEHTSELQSLAYLVCRLLLEKKNKECLYTGQDVDLVFELVIGEGLWRRGRRYIGSIGAVGSVSFWILAFGGAEQDHMQVVGPC